MTLHLARLTVSHFRSHLRARAAFDGRPVALWGGNGAGKTNLLEAISLLSPGRGLRRAAPDDLIRRPESLGWKITALIRSRATLYEVETDATPGTPRSVRIDTKTAAQSALGHLLPMLWLTPAMDRLWIESPEGRRRFLDRMTLALFPDHAEHALAYEKSMRDRNRLLRDGPHDPAWFTALETAMAEAGARLTVNRRVTLDRLGVELATDTAFPAPTLTLDCDAAADAADLGSALAAGRGRDIAAGRSLTGPHRADLAAIWAARDMPAAQCSTGEQKALLISMVLAHARLIAAERGHPPVLLLDEVAAHLDAGRRAALYEALTGLGAQAFLTGTGPELFTDLGARAQHFELTESTGGSVLSERPAPS